MENKLLRESANKLETGIYSHILKAIIKDTNATLLFRQIYYWWEKEWKGHKSGTQFYKFIDKCDHASYVPGESWCEELLMTRYEVSSALKKIGFKRGTSPKEQVPNKEEDAFVIYYTDNERKTWFIVNEDKYDKELHKLDSWLTKQPEKLPLKAELQNYLVNQVSSITKVNKETEISTIAEIKTEIIFPPTPQGKEKENYSDKQTTTVSQPSPLNEVLALRREKASKKKAGFSSFNGYPKKTVVLAEPKKLSQQEVYEIAHELSISTLDVKVVQKQVLLAFKTGDAEKYNITSIRDTVMKWCLNGINKRQIDVLTTWMEKDDQIEDWSPKVIQQRIDMFDKALESGFLTQEEYDKSALPLKKLLEI